MLQVRRGFIRKVYGILTIQLAVTAVFICCFIFIDSLRLYALRSRVLYWVAFAVMMVRLPKYPCNKCYNVFFLFSGVHVSHGVLREREEEGAHELHIPRHIHP